MNQKTGWKVWWRQIMSNESTYKQVTHSSVMRAGKEVKQGKAVE